MLPSAGAAAAVLQISAAASTLHLGYRAGADLANYDPGSVLQVDRHHAHFCSSGGLAGAGGLAGGWGRPRQSWLRRLGSSAAFAGQLSLGSFPWPGLPSCFWAVSVLL